MVLRYRRSKSQFYYRCRTPSSIGIHNDRQESITKGSVFFNKKSDINKVYIVLSEYFRKASIATIIRTVRISGPTVSQLAVDCQMLMHNDFIRYFGDYKLGDNELCDHIQIDESKFGKRKYNRGSRRDGVWVFGMVEALRTGITYSYTDPTTGVQETRQKFSAGRRMLCTVPNRTAATLLPILYQFCKEGAVIRSDGWRAYSSLHPDDVRLQNHIFAPANYSSSEFFFRRHEVVNHSHGFATRDNVEGNHTEGMINTNTIEGLWRDVKSLVHPRYRTAKHCPARLLEYLWRYENRDNGLIRGMERCLQEVSFQRTVSEGVTEDNIDSYEWITRAADGNVGAEIDDSQEDRHEPFQFEHDYHSDASSSEDSTDDEDWMPPTRSTAVTPGMIDSTAPIMDAMTDLAGRSSLETPTTRQHRRSRRVHRA